jgi:hypothetical protein
VIGEIWRSLPGCFGGLVLGSRFKITFLEDSYWFAVQS